ncbi:hypothetical protein DY000_02018311 [Brassica cretica]|uniref:Uncharacterized protein n=1 Tax=Brassica cretica TaxID=69181 RepID=A0ABQ7CWY9_BRACR|nr:hypothetical protein DY000_02018311 [Brassica cretica]
MSRSNEEDEVSNRTRLWTPHLKENKTLSKTKNLSHLSYSEGGILAPARLICSCALGRRILLKFLFETNGGMIRRAWSRGEISGDSGPAMARGFGRRPLLLGSTSLDGGETSRGRFDGKWTELRVTTFEDQEDEELSIMHLLVKRLMGHEL